MTGAVLGDNKPLVLTGTRRRRRVHRDRAVDACSPIAARTYPYNVAEQQVIGVPCATLATGELDLVLSHHNLQFAPSPQGPIPPTFTRSRLLLAGNGSALRRTARYNTPRTDTPPPPGTRFAVVRPGLDRRYSRMVSEP